MSGHAEMNSQNFLKNELSKYVSPVRKKKYLLAWNITRARRFAGQFLIVFICQYIAITQVIFSLPAPAMYPPMGVAFVMLYLFGGSSIPGLICVGIVAYFLKGFSSIFVLFYLLADVGACFLGVLLCQNSFSTDNPWSNNLKEWLGFITINFFITSCLSSLIRMIPFLLTKSTDMTFPVLFYNFIDLWLADLNAILVLFGFSITWLYLAYSRGSILLDEKMEKIPLLAVLACIILSAFFLKKIEFEYLILMSMLLSIYLSYRHGIIMATALLYFISFLYFAHFMIGKQQFLQNYGIELYTLVPLVLFIYSVAMLCYSCARTWIKTV